MNIRKLVFAGCCVVAGGVSFGAFVWPNLGSVPTQLPSPLSLTGARSLNLSTGEIVSCDENGPGQAVSFIAQNTQGGSKTTVIISEQNAQKTVAIIAVNAEKFLYSHYPDPIEHAKPVLIKGAYDKGGDRYKIKAPTPEDSMPSIQNWQEQLSLAKTICGGHTPDGITVTLRAAGVGAYVAKTLYNIDSTLDGLLGYRMAITREEAIKLNGLKKYNISLFL